MSLRTLILARCRAIMNRRWPDQVIGGRDDPYLLRWYLIPRNPLLNVYLRQFMRSDDDRALHDHPWANLSVLLEAPTPSTRSPPAASSTVPYAWLARSRSGADATCSP